MRGKLFATLIILAACNGGSAESGGSTADAMTTSGAGGTTSAEGSSGGVMPTTTGVDPSTTTMAIDTGSAGTTAVGGSSGEETGATTEPGIDCQDLADGPWEPVLWVEGYDGSEDLAFDGQGGLALKKGGGVVVVGPDKSESMLAMDVPPAYGTRYRGDGRLLVALPQDDKVIAIDDGGGITDFVTGLQGPNGIYPDLAGNVWITEFGGSRVLRVAPDLTETTIVMGQDAEAANGVVYDPVRGLLFYTKYQAGQVLRVAVDERGNAGTPELVVEIAGTSPDGLAMDACGYLYVVNQGGDELYRVLLDAAGEATATPEQPMAVFPSNVANVQFGAGPGFDPYTLYVAGNPGDVYTIAVEFPGAPIVTP